MLLKEGTRGNDVISLEYSLHIANCYTGGIDGIFGPNLKNSVKTFQEKMGLTIDGIVGTKTWNCLIAIIKKVQIALNKREFNLKVDGLGGLKTLNAIKEFQAKHSLTTDGFVGPRTEAMLGIKLYNNYTPTSHNSNNNHNGYHTNCDLNGIAKDKVSSNLIYFLKQKEGFSPTKYWCPSKVLTQGYGLTGKELQGLPNLISEEWATRLLTNNVNNKYYTGVLKRVYNIGVKNPLQREIDAFTSIAYNTGVEAFDTQIGIKLLQLYANGIKGEEMHSAIKTFRNLRGYLKGRREDEWCIFSNKDRTIAGYNCPPEIDIIGQHKIVKENNGYGARPY